jgi:uncharacterized membrane protein
MLAPCFIIDRDEGLFQAIGSSMRAMRGNKGTAFLIYVVLAVAGGLIMIVTCGLGLLGLIPYVAVLNAVMYLHATGEHVGQSKPEAAESAESAESGAAGVRE